jgi:probable phosphoglycerate mutase
MTEFWFIRHGESESNAGFTSNSDQSTPLTAKGKLQAQFVANHIVRAPDLFVVSPYLRANQTAEPTLSKFLTTPTQTWPIQEFSYLSHEQYQNTNSKQRSKMSQTFFKQADPDLVLGNGGESFNQFAQRIESCLERISQASEDLIILFGHGWFMRATLWYLYDKKSNQEKRKLFLKTIQDLIPSYPVILKLFSFTEKVRVKMMFRFLLFSAGVQIPNGGILKFKLVPDESVKLIDFELSHLPKELIEITWINR